MEWRQVCGRALVRQLHALSSLDERPCSMLRSAWHFEEGGELKRALQCLVTLSNSKTLGTKDAADATTQSQISTEALKKLAVTAAVEGALDPTVLRAHVSLSLAAHGEMTRLTASFSLLFVFVFARDLLMRSGSSHCSRTSRRSCYIRKVMARDWHDRRSDTSRISLEIHPTKFSMEKEADLAEDGSN
ncbi:uncharacterized protein LOC9656022 isoform X2 [Selaginella moellendorffii]|uniref:uncharacterized protein LOC9656022 isoform X2 n=1 Tax=Selaginella moellendorffii TaxID=88036 RepID=UPI000D1C79E0|nr:uncharacterized protein LOC9656022 isoform X2 [Selaginella moellendorffii]|eukprot:XP_024516806.1 uncharacterized protein LOC9656022 isoform X2 [Selaginella moellendorffii]